MVKIILNREVLKSKRISKQDLLNIINDKNVSSLTADMFKMKNKINRYDNDYSDETKVNRLKYHICPERFVKIRNLLSEIQFH